MKANEEMMEANETMAMKSEKNNEKEYKFLSENILKMIARYGKLCKEEQQELLARMADGDAAAQKEFALHHLSLVAEQVWDYQNCGIASDDLFFAGYVGVQEAAEKFDPSKGCFKSYAEMWISKRIIECIHKDGTIALPKEVYRQMKADYEAAGNNGPFRPYVFVSTSATVTRDEDGLTVEDTLAQDAYEDTDALTIRNERHALVCRILEQSGLCERDCNIVKMAYGIDCPKAKTAVEIAEEFGMTQQRVRQILKAGIEKMQKQLGIVAAAPEEEYAMAA